jgi:hypothetical protein
MAYFKIEQPGHAVKYIKEIDRANGTLEFSENREGCFQQDSGFFADSEFAYLKFHFTEAYPELEYMTIDTSYRPRNLQGVAVQEAPIDPFNMEAEEGPYEVEMPELEPINNAQGVAYAADYQIANEEHAPVMGQQIMQFNNAAATVTDDADITLPWG